MRNQRNEGFTLIEMIVTVAIIASLAAILVPIVSSELGDTAQSRALGDAQRIGTAITQYIKDTRYFPTGATGTESFEILIGDGTAIDAADNALLDDGGATGNLLDFLTNGAANGGTLWNGPYMSEVPADPWGNHFVVSVEGYGPTVDERVWVISAGPDGEITTAAAAFELADDDIGILID